MKRRTTLKSLLKVSETPYMYLLGRLDIFNMYVYNIINQNVEVFLPHPKLDEKSQSTLFMHVSMCVLEVASVPCELILNYTLKHEYILNSTRVGKK